ncbi:hypothetical protein EOI86_09280 [Hwanghaeella grinnelliae]|uniref:FecR protein domain-containing protein n=1 Tax=Hwanghaeella grinnelliae TaxID=2500179 RepID=A0A3S2VSD9_9PROT|nr:FecR domain-containing protein [Hwanghaeella grinnelliae]RVU39409.1 hypothetical protein EOI86_09280 [Hwanghaeella grinnelliae]
MATNQSNGQDAGAHAGKSVADLTPDYVFDGTSAAIVVPVGDALLNAEYSRSGPDLLLETPDGQLILVTDYFAQEIPPDLFTLAGSRITADVAAKLAGPRAPGQVAQNGELSTLEEPIGTVDTTKGVITVIRADGTQVTLNEGDALFQGDTLVSGADSAIGIIFSDKSTMSMAANARIILDELIYDPQDMASNSQVFNVIQGAFMFTGGAIGKSDPEDVSVKTPVATIGIRGTKFGVNVDALDGSTNVTIFEGAVFVQNGGGSVLLTGIGETTLISSYTLPPSDPEHLSLEEIQRIYGDAIGFHPVRQEIPDDHASADDDDLQDIADDLDDIDTAAGGDEQGNEGASDEFGDIGNQGIGESGLDGTPPGAAGEGDGDPGLSGIGSGGGDGSGDPDDGVLGGGTGGGSTGGGGSTVTALDPGEGDENGHFKNLPNLSPGNFSVSAPPGGGVQQLHLNASALGSAGNSSLTLQSGTTSDSVNPDLQSAVLSSTDGSMNLTINGFEELAITLGGGGDTIDIGDLSGTSIIPDTITIFAGDGDDTITTGETVDTRLVIDGGLGNDDIKGSEFGDTIHGNTGNEEELANQEGVDGNDTIDGGAGDDTLFGDGGDDTIAGGVGNDIIEGGAGNDVLSGGIAVVTEENGDTRVIGTDGIESATDDGADTISGGDGDDQIFGGSLADTLNGDAGNDDIQGSGGDDIVRGGAGDDLLDGGSGSDTVDGGEGDDRAIFVVGQEQTDGVNDAYDGGADSDTIVINYDTEALENPEFRQAILDIHAMLGNAASGSPEEFDTAPFQQLGLDIQNFETVELDGPSFAVLPEDGLSVEEDGSILLNLAVVDVLPGKSVSITIGNLNGASLVDGDGNPAGTENGDGTVTLTVDQLQGLTVEPAADSSDDLDLAVTVTTVDEFGTVEAVGETLDVTVTPVADLPDVTAASVEGAEDTSIALNISATVTDQDGSEAISPLEVTTGFNEGESGVIITGFYPNMDSPIVLSGFEPGTTFNAGSLVDGVLYLTVEDLPGLSLQPPADFSGDMELTISVTSTDSDPDSDESDTATATQSFVVSVAGVADAPTLSAENEETAEDSGIELNIGAFLTDSSEALSEVTISNFPPGTTFSAGTLTGGILTIAAADLAGLEMTPPLNFSGDINLTASVTSQDGDDSKTTTTNFTVTVEGLADLPTLELNDTAGESASPIPVDISSTLTDLDGSEELTITISGLNGATLSAGTTNEDGSVTLTEAELEGLTITPAPGTTGSIDLTVTAIATEKESHDSISVSGTVTVTITDTETGTGTVVLQPGQDLDLVAPADDGPHKLTLDAGFNGATTGDDWVIAQDALGRVTLTNTLTGQLVTADGYEEIDIDFGPGEDTVELRDLSNTDLTNDTLTLNMGDGDDTVTVGEDVNRDVELYGGAGNDDLQASNGDDLIDGGIGDDTVDGGEGSDTYLWAEGNGVDSYADTGKEGTDTVVVQAAAFDGIGDGFSAAQSGVDAIGRDADSDGVVDTGSPLLIALSDSSETVDFSGLDFLNSQTTIDLGGGDDTVTTAIGDGDAVTYTGGEGQDTLNLLLTAGSLNQVISSGQLGLLQSYIASPDEAVLTLTTPNIVAQGFETVRIGMLGSDGSVVDVSEALANATADNEGFGETIFGTNGADLIFAGGGNDVVRSFNGDDVLFGGDGEDYLNAGNGEDYVDGGTGNDIIDGGSGNDRLLGGDGADLVSGGQGDDYISGGDGNDFVAGFQGDDIVEGNDGDDNISGGSGQDSLYGGDGNDRLAGGSGDDYLIGGDGIDVLDGQTGDDVLIADDYEDQLFGGTGDDVLVSTMDELPESRVSSGAQGNFSGVRDGGEGVDTFQLNSDELGPHALSGDEFSNIRNIEILDLSGVDELQLSLKVEDVVTMTDEDNDLTILLGENVTSVEIDDETIQLEGGQAIFEQDGVQITLQQQQPPPEAS